MQEAPSGHKQLEILKGTLNQLIPLNYSWSPCTCLRDCLAVLIPHDPVCLLDSSRLESQPSDLPFTCNTTLYLLMRTLATCMFATVGVFCGYVLSVQTWIYMKCFNRKKNSACTTCNADEKACVISCLWQILHIDQNKWYISLTTPASLPNR